MWQEGEMSLGEPGGWCVSTHVNNLLLPCAGGSNERQERSVREDAAGWKRSAAGLARQPRWERKKRENESREDAEAVVILPFSVRLLWGSVESKKRSRLVVHTTHNRRYRRKKRCAAAQILWISMSRITTDSHHCEYVVFWHGNFWFYTHLHIFVKTTMKTIVFVIDSLHRPVTAQ